jgi:hypothetical protein
MICPITGEQHCKCDEKMKMEKNGNITIEKTLNKLFSDHVILLSSFSKAFLDDLPETEYIKKRLMQNPKDIGDFIGSLTNKNIGDKIANLLTDHIKGGGDALKALKIGDREKLEKAKIKIFDNSEKLAKEISQLNPNKLSFDKIHNEFNKHNQYELDLSKLHFNKEYQKEIDKFDNFNNHMLMFSTMLASGLNDRMGGYFKKYKLKYLETKNEH